tara:strand:+ start:113 stop:589 length:477 start_codon:yes stop_codon:yes gene_type:complete
MKKFLFIFIIFFISNCSLNKVVKHHGVPFLDKKQQKLTLNNSNKNDVIKLLGPPSTKSTFDNDIWVYIERKTTNSTTLLKLGKKKVLVNNVLIIELNSQGMLVKKDFFNKDNMEELKFSKNVTEINYSKRSFVYDFLSSLRQKVNDPLGKRKKGKSKY